MVAELGLDRPYHFTRICGKCCLFELGSHYPFTEPPEITAIFTRRAGGKPLCDSDKVLTVRDAFENTACFVFGLDKDMGCANLWCHVLQVLCCRR